MKTVNITDFNKFFYIVIFSFILIIFILSGYIYYSYESKLIHKTRYNELKAKYKEVFDKILE